MYQGFKGEMAVELLVMCTDFVEVTVAAAQDSAQFEGVRCFGDSLEEIWLIGVAGGPGY